MKVVSLYFYLDSEKFKYHMIMIFMIENLISFWGLFSFSFI